MKYNIYKDITYFGGIFVPRDVLSNKIRSNVWDYLV